MDSVRNQLEPENFVNSEEEQQRIRTYIVRRQGQTQFRQTLLEAYGGKCAITGFEAKAALEAAHIIPYVETSNNETTNGILLRADLHTLFDLHQLVIEPDTFNIFLRPDLRQTQYQMLHQAKMTLPKNVSLRPDIVLLRQRLKQCDWLFLD